MMSDTPAQGDRIFLHGLTAECIIGFIDWERRVKQTVVLDIELPVDCARAARSDEVADTLDYKKVAKRVLGFVEASEFKLVETLAHRLALVILEEFAARVGAHLAQQARRHPQLARRRRGDRAHARRPAARRRGAERARGLRRRRQQRRRPSSNLARAVAELARAFPGVRFSPWYRNRAVGFEGDDFINLVAGFNTELPLHAGARALQAIETAVRPAARRAALGAALDGPGRAAVRRSGVRVSRA